MSGGSTSTATQRRVSTVSTMLCMRRPALQPQLEAEDSLNLLHQEVGRQGEAEDSRDPQHLAAGRLEGPEAALLPPQ